MQTAEQKREKLPRNGESEVLWTVRVLLAAAICRAIRAGMGRDEIHTILREIEAQGGVND